MPLRNHDRDPDNPHDARRAGDARPAIAAWLCVAGGLLMSDNAAGVGAGAWFIASLIAALSAFTLGLMWRRRASLGALGIAAVLAAAGYHNMRIFDHPVWVGGDAGRTIIAAEGVILEHPRAVAPGAGFFARFLPLPPVTRTAIRADRVIDAAGAREASFVFNVRVSEAVDGLRAGDRVRIEGFFLPVGAPMNPGGADPRKYAAQTNTAGTLLIPTGDNITTLASEPGVIASARGLFRRVRADARAGARERLEAALGDSQSAADGVGALLAALLLGARDDAALDDLEAAMMRVGVGHMLAVSGLHMGVLIWLAAGMLRVGGTRARTAAALLAGLILLYMFLLPVRTPIVRTGIMALVWLAGSRLDRRPPPLGLLAWAGVAVLLWRPLELWSPGYQLSFGIVAAILTMPAIVERRWRPITPELDAMSMPQRARYGLERMLLVALCAWAVATPVIALHFGVVSVWGAVASVVFFPFLVLILGIGAWTLALAAVAPALAVWTGSVLGALGSITAWLARAMDSAPMSSFHAPPVGVWWAVATEVVVVRLLMRGVDRRGLAALALVVAWAGWIGVRPGFDTNAVALRIDTLAVGDGACHVIRSGTDVMLWDAGSLSLAAAERDIPRAIRALGVWSVPTIVLSHPNLDHYSAIPALVRPLGVREVIVEASTIAAARADPRGPVAALFEYLAERGVNVREAAAGDVIMFGEATLRFLHPERGTVWRGSNDASLVGLITTPTEAGERAVLMTGDIEGEAIDALLRSEPGLRADAIEAPHHGSARPRAIRFVAELDPPIVVQSTGPSRAGDDRWDQARAGRTWLTTATDGAVTLEVARDGAVRARTLRGDQRNVR